jgi:hypothetical protein
VPEPTTFGRKAPATTPAKPPERTGANALSSQAEAFRKSLKTDGTAGQPDFADWRRSQKGRRAVFWIASILLLTPGVISFVVDMPLEVSGGLEVLGIAGNWWLRRERKRHLKEIAAWDG